MSFPRYPKYKDSGVEWLGEVPEHWVTKRIGYFFKERREKVSDKDYPALSVTMGGIVPQIDTAAKSDDSDNRKRVCQGDFVINSRSDRKGSSGVSDLDGSVSLISIVLQPHDASGVHMPFVHHLLRSQLFQEEFYRNGKGIVADLWSTNFSAMRNILLAAPEPTEQNAIAAFLDRETAKIDGLVAEQRRLMELLKEKRQAVISHAVTKGLNLDAPMKPSGIKWLGDVPAGWEVPILSRLIEKADLGGNYEASESEFGIPLIKMGNLGRGVIKTEKVEQLPEDAEYDPAFRLETGDFLFNTRNSLDLVGKVAIWRDELPEAIYNSNILRIKFKEEAVATTAFMNYFFNSDLGISQLRTIAKGTTSVAAIYFKDLTTMRIILPPHADQGSIVAYLNEQCAQLDTLTAEAQRAIDLLQERRTALISAAVTGQIDVREEVPA